MLNISPGRFLFCSLALLASVFVMTTDAHDAWAEEAPAEISAEASTETPVTPENTPLTEQSALSSLEGSEGAPVVEVVPSEEAEAGHGAEDAGHGASPAGESIGFPQLNTETYPSQIFWLLVSFVLLYALMAKIALPRITEVLDMRQTQRDGNLDRAAQLNDEAEKVRTTYEAALASAQGKAQEAISAVEDAMAEKAAAEMAKFSESARLRVITAEKNIAKAREDALSSLADISADVAAEMVAKISGVQVNRADARKAVLAEMQKSGT